MSKIPGYNVVKNLSRKFAGTEDKTSFVPAAISLGGGIYAVGFIIEETTDGFCTVMIPGAPNPTAGMLRYLPIKKVRKLDVPISKVFDCITFWGHGYGELLASQEPGAVDSNSDSSEVPRSGTQDDRVEG